MRDIFEMMRSVRAAAGRQGNLYRYAPIDPSVTQEIQAAISRYWLREWLRQFEQSPASGPGGATATDELRS